MITLTSFLWTLGPRTLGSGLRSCPFGQGRSARFVGFLPFNLFGHELCLVFGFLLLGPISDRTGDVVEIVSVNTFFARSNLPYKGPRKQFRPQLANRLRWAVILKVLTPLYVKTNFHQSG